jgi:hypothetical protein
MTHGDNEFDIIVLFSRELLLDEENVKNHPVNQLMPFTMYSTCTSVHARRRARSRRRVSARKFFLGAWSIASVKKKKKKALGVLSKGIRTPSFIETAPAVTKRALLTDVDDGRHVIAIHVAHQR